MMIRWFLVGFAIRASLGIIVTIGLNYDQEAGMLYLLDFPTVAALFLLERFVSPQLSGTLAGNHPYYVQLNLFASFLWGGMFMVTCLAVKAILRRGKPDREGKG